MLLKSGVKESIRRYFKGSASLQGQPLLSISERQELCQTDCMFCLDVRDAGVGFETNLDAVARSGVRVNPRVLQLARRKGGA